MGAVHGFASVYFILFFLVLSVSRPVLPLKCRHRMMSTLANNYRPFLSSFRHIPSQEFCEVSELTIHEENGRGSGEMFIWSKLGQNPSEIDVRTYARKERK